MNPSNIIPTIEGLEVLARNVTSSGKRLEFLLKRAKQSAIRNEFQFPLTQAEVNQLVTVYLPLYNEARRQIEIAADALATDSLN